MLALKAHPTVRYGGRCQGAWRLADHPLEVQRGRLAGGAVVWHVTAPIECWVEASDWLQTVGLWGLRHASRRAALQALEVALHASPPPWLT